MMKLIDTKLSIGGIFRCCEQTWSEWVEDHQGLEIFPTDEFQCKWCDEILVLDIKGVWRMKND